MPTSQLYGLTSSTMYIFIIRLSLCFGVSTYTAYTSWCTHIIHKHDPNITPQTSAFLYSSIFMIQFGRCYIVHNWCKMSSLYKFSLCLLQPWDYFLQWCKLCIEITNILKFLVSWIMIYPNVHIRMQSNRALISLRGSRVPRLSHTFDKYLTVNDYRIADSSLRRY